MVGGVELDSGCGGTVVLEVGDLESGDGGVAEEGWMIERGRL